MAFLPIKMRFKLTFKITIVFIVFSNLLIGQNNSFQQFKRLSCSEKRWVVFHPFVAKKALNISLEARNVTAEIKQQQLLKGMGNGDQLDAFRHTYWMARLAQEIHWRKAKRLGKAHEKGNYRQFKKGKLEDGALPDKISTEMDLFNNDVGLILGKSNKEQEVKNEVIKLIKEGKCKMLKTDANGNFLDENNNIIPIEELKGKWENRKVLVDSDKFFN
ncbi:MAG: hypothetical protein KFKLKKLM_01859 [Flavobacteriales bacterium]|nr:hypothetical protein [Flavobacteriales bacterium]